MALRTIGERTCKGAANRIALVLLFLALAAELLSLFHHVAVPHGVCPVHPGELVHGPLETHGEPTGGAGGERREPSVQDVSEEDFEKDMHEEHCALVVLLRGGTAEGFPAGFECGVALVSVRAAGTPRANEPWGSFPLYLLAPKASPPAPDRA